MRCRRLDQQIAPIAPAVQEAIEIALALALALIGRRVIPQAMFVLDRVAP